MRLLKPLVVLSLLVLFTLIGCRPDSLKPGDPLVVIPEEATSVTALNLDRLMDKADFDEVRQMAFYENFLVEARKENAALGRILEDPRQAGIDLENNVYLSVEIDKADKSGLIALVFAISDKEMFEGTLENLELEYLPANRDPGLFQEKGVALVWNESIGIIGIGKEESVQQQTEAYLNTPKERSITRNSNLRKALSKDFDVLNWISSEAFVELLDIGFFSKAARYSEEDLRDNYLQSFLYFEKGAFRAETEFHFSGKLSNDLALIFNKNVKTDFSDKIPSDDLFYYSNVGIRPKGINQLLIEYHIRGLSDEPFKAYGFSFDDLINAFSGDAAVAVYQKKDGFLNLPGFLLALDVDSRENMDHILYGAQQNEILDRIGPDRYRILGGMTPDSLTASEVYSGPQLLIKDDILYISDRREKLDEIASGDFNADGELLQSMQKLSNKQAYAALMDMVVLSEVEDDIADFPVKTVETTAGRDGAGTTVKMINEEDNSLRQFFQWLNQQYLREQSNDRDTTDEKIGIH